MPKRIVTHPEFQHVYDAGYEAKKTHIAVVGLEAATEVFNRAYPSHNPETPSMEAHYYADGQFQAICDARKYADGQFQVVCDARKGEL